jgi:hypothetical protein
MRKLILFCVIFICSILALAQGPSYPYSTIITFTASTSPGVTGYNMYRGPYTTSCPSSIAGYTKLNVSPFSATTYTDNNPPMGAYCYASTSLAPINGVSTESGLSIPVVNVIIPPVPPTNLNDTIGQVGTNGSYMVTWQWTQSTSGQLTNNTLYCKTSKTQTNYVSRWSSTKPVTSVGLLMVKGYHQCIVTANYLTDISGPSNVRALQLN